jgi:hypothetical protein
VNRLIFVCLLSAAVFTVNAQQAEPIEVAVFLSCECPISQKYISTLNGLYVKYRDESSLRWHFIVPEQIKLSALDAFVTDYQVRFPIERDTKRRTMVEKFHANVTPQAVILRGESMLYSGAVDNWFYDLGQYRQVITENYLKDALDAVLSGKTPKVERTEAIGCPIAKR